MCGIIGIAGGTDAVGPVLSGLENLEYRGYDSAGVALRNGHGLAVSKRAGEISALADELGEGLPAGDTCIGHTRWSTHGPPTDANAHPHTDCSGRVAVVHNGIVENHADLRSSLAARGHEFDSDTDTEVVPHLVEAHLADGADAETAFRRTLADLEGSYALAMLVAGEPGLYAARQGSPLVLGLGEDRSFVASDVPAFLEHTDRVVFLEDGDVAAVRAGDYRIVDREGTPVDRPVRTVDWTPEDARKEGYDHYMLKEINEQPEALRGTLRGRLTTDPLGVDLSLPEGWLDDVRAAHLVACGTSYHASLYGAHLLSRRGIDAQAHLASEYPARTPHVPEDTLVVGVTQSGETADTLRALRHAADHGARTLAVTNVLGSTAARECDEALFIRAGPEIGVAASKTFSSQVVTLALLAGHLAARDGPLDEGTRALLSALPDLPDAVGRVLAETAAPRLARQYSNKQAYFFIGRGTAHPVALEGALKFKEISYEHAEGFPAGELKHGPLALVTEETPVFAVFSGREVEKTLGNVREVRARGAPVIAVASEGEADARREADELLTVPDTHPDLVGLLANVQLQLISYHVSDLLDRAIDKPRNLAKSVTVE
jgi:glucosamine--fructose-6-phosphate aminotransferase (isomerizing)